MVSITLFRHIHFQSLWNSCENSEANLLPESTRSGKKYVTGRIRNVLTLRTACFSGGGYELLPGWTRHHHHMCAVRSKITVIFYHRFVKMQCVVPTTSMPIFQVENLLETYKSYCTVFFNVFESRRITRAVHAFGLFYSTRVLFGRTYLTFLEIPGHF